MKGGRFFPPALVFAAALAAWAASAGYGFVFDERILIVDNPAASLARPDLIFGAKFWPGQTQGIYYRPLTILSYALGNALGGSTLVHHLFSILLHAAVSALAFLFARRLLRDDGAALFAGLVFAVHPIHLENVAWAPGRTDVLATGFMLASWLTLLASRGREGAARFSLLAAALALFAVSLLGKEIALAFPLLAILLDLSREGRKARVHAREYGLLILAAVVFLAIRQAALAGPGAPPAADPLSALSLPARALAAAALSGKSVFTMAFPAAYRVDFHYESAVLGSPLVFTLFLAGLAAATLALAAALFKRHPRAAFLALAMLASFLPSSHLIPFPTLFAERFLYLPSLFFCVGLALVAGYAGLFAKAGRARRRAASAMAGALLAALAALAVSRAGVFKSDVSFWREAARQRPDLALARNWLGLSLFERGLTGAAVKQYDRALALDSSFYPAAMNKAEVLIRQGRVEEAAALLAAQAESGARDPGLFFNLGLAYLGLEDPRRALEAFDAALALNPDYFPAHAYLAHYYLGDGRDRAKARAHWDAARRINPGHPLVREIEGEFNLRYR